MEGGRQGRLVSLLKQVGMKLNDLRVRGSPENRTTGKEGDKVEKKRAKGLAQLRPDSRGKGDGQLFHFDRSRGGRMQSWKRGGVVSH